MRPWNANASPQASLASLAALSENHVTIWQQTPIAQLCYSLTDCAESNGDNPSHATREQCHFIN
jgi:hypothetical protein